MTIDILAALTECPTRAGSSKPCKIQRWLNEIDHDTPGKADLVATLTTTDPRHEQYRTLDELDRVTQRLGLQTSIKTIGEHRQKRCRCYL